MELHILCNKASIVILMGHVPRLIKVDLLVSFPRIIYLERKSMIHFCLIQPKKVGYNRKIQSFSLIYLDLWMERQQLKICLKVFFFFLFLFLGGGGTKVQEYLSKNDVPIELLWSKINRLSLGFVYQTRQNSDTCLLLTTCHHFNGSSALNPN